MVGFISYRFKFDYALCAIAALFHDVLVLCGIFAIMGLVAGTEVDSLFISAVLTVIGFSVHDTIVVFDRIRENAKYVGSKIVNPETKEEYKRTFGDIANDSVNQDTETFHFYIADSNHYFVYALPLWWCDDQGLCAGHADRNHIRYLFIYL